MCSVSVLIAVFVSLSPFVSLGLSWSGSGSGLGLRLNVPVVRLWPEYERGLGLHLGSAGGGMFSFRAEITRNITSQA